ncbi:DNA gyrase subunit A [Suttonella ornithocola]|uniref:DNA gyrase subunit A n=1 Tax=Suttonella ornithocola TaxID=279832 RepID=A0A380MR33_9GAMM|nr:DNA gyrase subunit A [Suttonella ornithocola]SUO94772.1 DNA gyrase subunit A [Suttonella ornithocola]
MSDFAREILPVSLVDEMRNSYLDYAMSVIIGRALPDARDGLKPVHRRVLFSMNKNGNAWNKKYVKSARVIGDVMGSYHPHGDSAIYDTLVRMAQPFSLRYPLIDGQGNFGSIDGDPPAAHRYTEARMAKIAHSLLTDIEKETVDFVPNYDGSQTEPTVLPTRIPNLLVNGGTGIAVGMATNIPPHNLGETLDACLHLMDHPEANTSELMRFLPGPDFPTGALINGSKGIKEAYETGRGRVYIRAKTHIETDEHNGKQSIIVDELPYQVNKANLLTKISDLVKEKKIEGITALRDESDKDGIRMVIELRRGEVAEVILNNLFQLTQLQTVFGINMVALIGGQPKILNLRECLNIFISHRREVVTRRTIYELRKARERAHILEGLSIALANIDEVIQLIRESVGPSEAKAALLARAWQPGQVVDMLARAGAENSRPDSLSREYGLIDGQYFLSPEQAQAILDLRLHRLTGLEQDKIIEEFQSIIKDIESFLDILQIPERLIEVIREELLEIKAQFNDERRTQILDQHLNLSLEDLIAEEDRVITLSHEGYIKAQPLSDYEAQKRGGKGRSVTAVKDEDFVEQLFVANTHDTMLCFSNKGKVYWLKVYELPQAGRNAKGKPIINLLPFEKDERLNAILTTREYPEDQYLFFATKGGTVKKTPLAEYSRPRASGIIAINLSEDDELVDVAITDGSRDIMLFSNAGKAVRFEEQKIRSVSRGATGVKGMTLENGQRVIALCVVQTQGDILTITENGYGKRTPAEDYPTKGRGGKGIISIACSERNGDAVYAVQVSEDEQIMLVTNNGTLVRTRVSEISVSRRNTQGVRLIRTSDAEKLIAVAKIVSEESEEEPSNEE